MRGLALLLLLACETMESPGTPLEAVPVEPLAPVPMGGMNAQGAPEEPSTSDPVDEPPASPVPLAEEAAGLESADSNGTEALLQESTEPPAVETSSVPELEELVGIEACLAPKPGAGPDVNLGGTLRLRRTVMEEGRPVAWVELPDGTAVVAQVGSMFPSFGMVVMSIGEGQIQVAQISPSLHGAEASLLIQTLTHQE